ncbi:MAG: T9SS type A sorting domain-containing protein [candidate division KSB1 bacterium]|nr:T9SS type A sorting domain-containing protein [candidate division KSB1 bacterium]
MRIEALLIFLASASGAAEITVNAAAGHRPISPYIYGKNNTLSDDPARPLSAAQWQFLRDTGIRIFRDNGGNNSTKYNWRRKLTSHPDWYNNVYPHDWDYAAKSLQQNLPYAKALWALQLIGWAAASRDYNFNDWEYNRSQWWEGVNNNWAGGGGPNIGNGDPTKYLMEWPADSTVGILRHWFEDLGLNPDQFVYWNMDNEPEVWNGTHDDVIPKNFGVEEYLQRYFAVAKAARAAFPEIKLLGPVSTNEWQWFNWNNEKITAGGKSYVWLEYFIKRVAEEQTASGMRLLDLLDLHFYPGETNPADILQLHRVWFDKTYNYPGANGVKRSGPTAWDNNITKEYIFQRCRDWLVKYMGEDHGVGLSVSEMGVRSDDPNVIAVWYASTLGTFADYGVEIFTPWDWKVGMYEVVHLFSRYAQEIRVESISDGEPLVSAYSSVNESGDSLTVVLVNRSLQESRSATVRLRHFSVADGTYPALALYSLPKNETFKSHSKNALKSFSAEVKNAAFALELPPLSVTAMLLTGRVDETRVSHASAAFELNLSAAPNPFNPQTRLAVEIPAAGKVTLEVFDVLGRRVAVLYEGFCEAGRREWTIQPEWPAGVYWLRLRTGEEQKAVKVVLLK